MNRKSIALIIGIGVIVTFSVISVPMLSRGISESSLARRYVSSAKAFWAAEGGVQRALHDLRTDPALSSWGDADSDGKPDTTVNLNTATVSVEVDLSGSNPVIDSQGQAKTVVRSLQATLTSTSSSPFYYAGFGKSSLTMSGNGETDSYDSSQGPYGGENVSSEGDIGTNSSATGAISLSGNATVNGDASTGENGTVKITGNAEVNGDISDDCSEDFPFVEVPSSLTSLPAGGSYSVGGNNSQTLTPGDYKFSSITVSGNGTLTLQGPINIYLTDESDALTVSGNGKIIVTSDVNIYVDGKCTIGGNGVVNNSNLPEDFIIYSTYSGSSNGIKITGNGDLYGAVYAPDTEIKIAGNGDVYGSLIGGSLKVAGNGDLHYDEALQNISTSISSGYTIGSWEDKNAPYKL